ncbi:MAG: zinc-finger domain-containing protein [Aquabacterium sp.]|nr:zinc-finger domain-containing protein [Aquabacterium sp.]
MSTSIQTPMTVVEVTAAELLGPGVVYCPNPKQDLGSNHPKVFIDVATKGQGKCPYCGTVYKLKAGEKVSHGH